MDLAEVAFDVLITLDTNLHYQQNLSGRKIAIIVLKSFSNRLEHLRQRFPSVPIRSGENQAWRNCAGRQPELRITRLRLPFPTQIPIRINIPISNIFNEYLFSVILSRDSQAPFPPRRRKNRKFLIRNVLFAFSSLLLF